MVFGYNEADIQAKLTDSAIRQFIVLQAAGNPADLLRKERMFAA